MHHRKISMRLPKNIEVVMIFLIAICQIALVTLSNTTISQVSDISQYGFFTSQIANDEEVLTKLKDWNLDFRPNACKLISMYDENLELKLRLYFMKTPDKDLVRTNLEFQNYVMNHDQGYLDVDVGESVEHVFFRWIPDPHGGDSMSLITVRVNQPTYLYVWIYPIVTVLNIGLVFALMVIIMLKRRQDGIDHYMTISSDRRFI